ncbi:MAG: hypothetical protein NVSMB42_11440 [Herpetosiphon sp.]
MTPDAPLTPVVVATAIVGVTGGEPGVDVMLVATAVGIDATAEWAITTVDVRLLEGAALPVVRSG